MKSMSFLKGALLSVAMVTVPMMAIENGDANNPAVADAVKAVEVAMPAPVTQPAASVVPVTTPATPAPTAATTSITAEAEKATGYFAALKTWIGAKVASAYKTCKDTPGYYAGKVSDKTGLTWALKNYPKTTKITLTVVGTVAAAYVTYVIAKKMMSDKDEEKTRA